MKDLIRRNFVAPAMAIPVILSLLYLVPSMLMTTLWINLRSVTISDAPSAYEARIEVDRSIRFDFYGRYTVSVREAGTGAQVCAVGSISFDYKGGPSGEVNKPLSWWFGGAAHLASCITDGFHDDRFYIVTCHDVLLARAYPFARRCVPSNVFTLGRADHGA